MTERPPDPFSKSDDDQEIEVAAFADDLGDYHVIEPDDPAHTDTLDERLWRELPDGPERVPRSEHRLVAPDEGLGLDLEDEAIGEDVGRDGGDFSAEERAVRIDPDF